jgi:hypothetical protein
MPFIHHQKSSPSSRSTRLSESRMRLLAWKRARGIAGFLAGKIEELGDAHFVLARVRAHQLAEEVNRLGPVTSP